MTKQKFFFVTAANMPDAHSCAPVSPALACAFDISPAANIVDCLVMFYCIFFMHLRRRNRKAAAPGVRDNKLNNEYPLGHENKFFR